MRNKLLLSTSLLIGIVIVVNLLSSEFRFRLDMTEDGQYTLSQATKDILDELNEPVTIKAYFSEDLPPQFTNARRDFKETLVEYANLADGNLVYEFINPNEGDETEQEAIQNGISPVQINVREKNQVIQKKAYLGAVVSVGDRKDVIPFIQPGGATEYALSTSIKKISDLDKPFVGWIQGHGEPVINAIPEAYQSLSVLYNVQSLPITDTTSIPEQYRTIVIANPSDTFPPAHLQQFDAFLGRGGRMMIAMNRVDGDLQNQLGSAVNTGLEEWLRRKGLVVQDNFVIDVNANQITVRQQNQGFFSLSRRVQFPYLPIITNFADHPITKGLETVAFEFVSDMYFEGKEGVSYTPIAFSSEKSGAMRAPQYFDIQRQWNASDFPQQNLTVAATLEGTLSGDAQSKMVVVGDGDFGINGLRNEARQLPADNVSLLVNSIDWLTDDTGLIELRTKGATSRPIKEMEDSTKDLLKYLNFLLPIALVILYGVVRSQIRARQRLKRREENYS